MYGGKEKPDATCHLCKIEPENREHFLSNCSALSGTCARYLAMLEPLITNISGSDHWQRLVNNKKLLTTLILEPSHPVLGLHLTKEKAHNIEHCTRRLCFALHCERSVMLEIAPASNRQPTNLM
jgi:hypothetical protein